MRLAKRRSSTRSRLVAEAWRSFDRFRPEEPPLDDRVRRLLEAGLPVGSDARPRGARRRRAHPRRVDRAGAAALLRVHRLERPGDRRPRRLPRAHLRHQPRGRCPRGHAGRGSGRAVGRRSSSGSRPAGGAFTSGGTISNVSALAAARERALPGSRHTGLGGRRVAVYCSQEVHYSVTRAVELLGIGSDNLRALPLDGLRRMRPDALAEAIDADVADGRHARWRSSRPPAPRSPARSIRSTRSPTCVSARGVWLHVDGAYGLPAAATESRAAGFAGLARADSCSVDAHKWLYLPKACGVVLVTRRRCPRRRVRARAGLPAAPAARAARRRHHAGVLAAVPRPEDVARVPGARRGAVPRRDRAQPGRGGPAVPPRAGDRGLRGHGGAAAAVDRADPPRAARASPTSMRTTRRSPTRSRPTAASTCHRP